MRTQTITKFQTGKAINHMKLQLFADGGAEGGAEGATGSEGASGGEPQADENSVDALKVLLAQAKAENAKLKNTNNSLASENASKTKLLREKMTAQEQEAEAKKEAEAAREKEFNDMKRKLNVIESTNTYMEIFEMSKETAQQYAEARADGDRDKENDVLRAYMKSYKAKLMQNFLAERGEINAGHGDDKEDLALELVKSLPKRSSGVDENILKMYM